MFKKFFILLSMGLFIQTTALAEDFPLREKFPKATPITTQELFKSFSTAVIIDVRTAMEYDVAHVLNATLIPLDDPAFLERTEVLRSKQSDAPLVFYCNGRLCAKSYKAAEKATNAGFTNAKVYDAGVMPWLKAYPNMTALLDQTPADAQKIISNEKFIAHQISFEQFNTMSGEKNTLVIDIRDDSQRKVKADLAQNAIMVVKGTRIQSIPSDQFAKFIKANGFKDQQLLIADAVGVQIRWAQYFLEEHGYTDYHFLKGGVKAAVEAGYLKL